jgi:hypothetical protein
LAPAVFLLRLGHFFKKDKIMIKYLAEDWYSPTIKQIETLKETEKSFWYDNGNRSLKETNDQKLCDTFDQAKSWLLKRHEHKVSGVRHQLEDAKSKLGNVKGMRDHG